MAASDHLSFGEDFDVLPDGRVNLHESAIQKLWDMATPLPTEEDGDEAIRFMYQMAGIPIPDDVLEDMAPFSDAPEK